MLPGFRCLLVAVSLVVVTALPLAAEPDEAYASAKTSNRRLPGWSRFLEERSRQQREGSLEAKRQRILAWLNTVRGTCEHRRPPGGNLRAVQDEELLRWEGNYDRAMADRAYERLVREYDVWRVSSHDRHYPARPNDHPGLSEADEEDTDDLINSVMIVDPTPKSVAAQYPPRWFEFVSQKKRGQEAVAREEKRLRILVWLNERRGAVEHRVSRGDIRRDAQNQEIKRWEGEYEREMDARADKGLRNAYEKWWANQLMTDTHWDDDYTLHTHNGTTPSTEHCTSHSQSQPTHRQDQSESLNQQSEDLRRRQSTNQVSQNNSRDDAEEGICLKEEAQSSTVDAQDVDMSLAEVEAAQGLLKSDTEEAQLEDLIEAALKSSDNAVSQMFDDELQQLGFEVVVDSQKPHAPAPFGTRTFDRPNYAVEGVFLLHDMAERAEVTGQHQSWSETIIMGPGPTAARLAYETVEGAKLTGQFIKQGATYVFDSISDFVHDF